MTRNTNSPPPGGGHNRPTDDWNDPCHAAYDSREYEEYLYAQYKSGADLPNGRICLAETERGLDAAARLKLKQLEDRYDAAQWHMLGVVTTFKRQRVPAEVMEKG